MAIATLLQENLAVGTESNVGPPLTTSESLQEFTRLSLYPEMSYCSAYRSCLLQSASR